MIFLIAAKFSFFSKSYESKPEEKNTEQKISDDKPMILPTNNIAFLPDGSSYQVQQTAECIINERSFKLLSGTIHFSVKPCEKPFFVKTPFGIVSVVGTDFSVAVTSNTMKVAVFSGKVRVEDCYGSFKLLSKGDCCTCPSPIHPKNPASTTSDPIFDSAGDVDFPNSQK